MSKSIIFTIFLMGAIFGSVAMFVMRENEIKPLKIFSQCLNQKTIYLDTEPYLEMGSLRDCYEIYLASLQNTK